MESLATVWALWRMAKLTSAVVFFAGVLGVIHAPSRAGRLSMLYRYAVPGFVLTWAAGWMLMRLTGRAPTEPWILAGALASAGSLHCAFLTSDRPRPRSRPATPMLATGLFVAAMAAMVVRTSTPLPLIVWLVVGGALGALIGVPAARARGTVREDDSAVAWSGFRWLGRLEAASLLAMLLVSMPLKYALHWSLDGGTGLLGWVHGVLVIVYLQAAMSTARMLRWPRALRMLAVAAAFLPAGPLWLESRLQRAVGRPEAPR